MKAHRCLVVLFLAMSGSLAGCTSSGGEAPIRYYLIDPVEAAPLRDSNDPLVVEIVDLHLPQYLERYQIATRSGANQLVFSESHQWSENLRKNLMRTLARNLGRLLATDDVSTPLTRSASLPDYRVQLAIEAFELRTTGDVRLDARWQLTDTGGATLLTRRAELHGPPAGSGYAGLVAQMRVLYGDLSRRVAESLLEESPGGGKR